MKMILTHANHPRALVKEAKRGNI